MVAIILIHNAEWRRYKRKSDCETVLPPITAHLHLGSSTELSTVAPQAWGYRFKSLVGICFQVNFSFFFKVAVQSPKRLNFIVRIG